MNKSVRFKQSMESKSSAGQHYTNMLGSAKTAQGFADKRKRKIVNQYNKLLRKTNRVPAHSPSEPTANPTSPTPNRRNEDTTQSPDASAEARTTHKPKEHKKFSRGGATETTREGTIKNHQLSRYTAAERNRRQETDERQRTIQEKHSNRESREKAMMQYRNKKLARHRQLSKRTPRGQPIIKYQMDYIHKQLKKQQNT